MAWRVGGVSALTVFLLSSASTVPAWAQAAQPAGVAQTAPSAVEEVTVTAQRRSQRLVDVPVSVSVLESKQMEVAGVVGTRDLNLTTPGLVSGQAGYVFQPSIRGISSNGTTAGDESNVALYVDDVYIAAMGATAFNLANIDHVEVSKGPQGTLFGRNATGGAIRVVTSNPTFDPSGHVSVSAGLDGAQSREISAYGTTGLTDTLAASLALYAYDDNGYLKNADPNYQGDKQGSLNTYTARAKFLYTPTEQLQIVASLDYSRTKSGVELTTSFVDGVNGFKNVLGVIDSPNPREVSTNEQNWDKGVNDGASINAQYNFGDYMLKSVTAYRQAHLSVSLDNDRTNLPLNRNQYRVKDDTFSEELTLTSQLDGPLNFVAGLYYFWMDASNPFFSIYSAQLSPVVGGVRTIVSPLALASSIDDDLTTNSYAAFVDGTYNFTDQLSLAAGLRYNEDIKQSNTTNLLAPGAPAARTHGSWGDLDYRVSLNYKPTPNSLLYVSNTTGFKAGMINAAAYTYPNPQNVVKPEKVNAYEAGYKTELFEGMTLSASAFTYKYRDIQLTVNNALSAQAGVVGVNILQNAASAKISGADLDFSGQLDEHWNISAGLSWLPQAEYSQFQGGIFYQAAPGGLGAIAQTADLSGSRILRSPKFTYNLGATYTTPLGANSGTIALSANYFNSSAMYMVVGQSFAQPAYSILALEADWTDPSSTYTVSLWAHNVGNEAYYVSGLANTGGFSAVWAKPREIGIRLTAAFN